MSTAETDSHVTAPPFHPHQFLLHWLWLAGLVLFFLYVSWDSGLLPQMIPADKSYLSLLILAVFAVACLHSGYRSYFLFRQANAFARWRMSSANPSPDAGDAVINEYLPKMRYAQNEQQRQTSAELLAERLRGQHQVGWFITSALIKLGLLGTEVGFVIMLASVGSLESLDIEQVQVLMQKMTQGMKIALNTTILGLVGSMLLGMQYLFLDRSADGLLASAVQWAQQVGNDQIRQGAQ